MIFSKVHKKLNDRFSLRMFVVMKHTLGKEERLKSRKLIGKLYEEGKTLKKFPLKMVYIQTEHTSNYPAQVGVSVPKRNFKKAVDRNRIKRLLRESYRLQKDIVYTGVNEPYVFMISYLAREEWPYAAIEEKMRTLLTLFVEKISNHEDKKN